MTFIARCLSIYRRADRTGHLLLVLPLWLFGCQTTRTDEPQDLSIAAGDYVVLTQKALTYQADFDMQAWAGMLADDVVFIPSEGGPVYRKKAVVVANWLQWRQKNRIRVFGLSQLTHLPVRSRHQLPLTGKAGVYVISYCLADLQFTDGRTRRLSLHVCCHFDPQKRIDYYSLYFPAGASDQTAVLRKSRNYLNNRLKCAPVFLKKQPCRRWCLPVSDGRTAIKKTGRSAGGTGLM